VAHRNLARDLAKQRSEAPNAAVKRAQNDETPIDEGIEEDAKSG
jgi:hypothetical protein